MGITPNFYLRAGSKNNTASIQLAINFDNKRLRYGTGLSINVDHWNKENQLPIVDKKVLRKLDEATGKQLKTIKNNLDSISKLVLKRHAYLIEQEITPTPALFKSYLNDNLPWKNNSPVKDKLSLIDYFDQYIKEMKSGKRTTDKGKQFAKGTIKNYVGCLNQFQDYQTKKRRKLQFEDVTLDLYDNIIAYFNAKDYSPNTIGRHIKNLKTITGAAYEEGLHKNDEFRRKKFKTIKVETNEIYLTEEEVKAIFNLDLTANKAYDEIRDVFLAGVYTAQRYSDYSKLNKSNIKKTSQGNRIAKITQKKTGEIVQIPIRPELEAILKKYDSNLPSTYEQRVNKVIKIIGKMAGIDSKEQVEKIKGGLKIKTTVPKHDLIKTHTARRTGVTNLYLAGIPTLAIQKLSGHRTEKNLLLYIKVTKEQNADILAKHLYFRQSLKVIK